MHRRFMVLQRKAEVRQLLTTVSSWKPDDHTLFVLKDKWCQALHKADPYTWPKDLDGYFNLSAVAITLPEITDQIKQATGLRYINTVCQPCSEELMQEFTYFGQKHCANGWFLAYHRTTSEKAILICDRRYDESKCRRGLYGRGFYVAKDASTTIKHSGQTTNEDRQGITCAPLCLVCCCWAVLKMKFKWAARNKRTLVFCGTGMKTTR